MGWPTRSIDELLGSEFSTEEEVKKIYFLELERSYPNKGLFGSRG